VRLRDSCALYRRLFAYRAELEARSSGRPAGIKEAESALRGLPKVTRAVANEYGEKTPVSRWSARTRPLL